MCLATDTTSFAYDAAGRLVPGANSDIAGLGPASIRLVHGALGAVVHAENLTAGATAAAARPTWTRR